MTGPAGGRIASSQEVDIGAALRRARRHGLLRSLARIYSEFPETTCDNCARCCFESPGLFFIEYLHLLALLSEMQPRQRQILLRRSLEELFFSWIKPDLECLFLESSRCTIYQQRPLACRLFGLVAPADRAQAEAEARLAARREAQHLRLLGISVPETVVQRSLVSCEQVRDRRGQAVRVDGDAIAARVARLDCKLLPQEVVVREFCFQSLPERLGAAAYGGESVALIRLQLLRRAGQGMPLDQLLDSVRRQACLPSVLSRDLPGG